MRQGRRFRPKEPHRCVEILERALGIIRDLLGRSTLLCLPLALELRVRPLHPSKQFIGLFIRAPAGITRLLLLGSSDLARATAIGTTLRQIRLLCLHQRLSVWSAVLPWLQTLVL